MKLLYKISIAVLALILTMPVFAGLEGYDQSAIESFINSGTEGTIFSVKNSYSSSSHVHFSLGDSNTFNGEYLLGNYTAKDANYSITCLLDYIQINCNDEEKEAHSVEVKSMEYFRGQIHISEIASGKHDFLVIVLKNGSKLTEDFLYERKIVRNSINKILKHNEPSSTIQNVKNELTFKEGLDFKNRAVNLGISNKSDSLISYKIILILSRDDQKSTLLPLKNIFLVAGHSNAQINLNSYFSAILLIPKIRIILVENPYQDLEINSSLVQEPRSVRMLAL